MVGAVEVVEISQFPSDLAELFVESRLNKVRPDVEGCEGRVSGVLSSAGNNKFSRFSWH